VLDGFASRIGWGLSWPGSDDSDPREPDLSNSGPKPAGLGSRCRLTFPRQCLQHHWPMAGTYCNTAIRQYESM